MPQHGGLDGRVLLFFYLSCGCVIVIDLVLESDGLDDLCIGASFYILVWVHPSLRQGIRGRAQVEPRESFR